jgi:23S rRNA pseudouridine2605 synthase
LKKPHPKKEPEKPSRVESIRLNRFLSNAGICSRREADKLIGSGKVKLEGKVITEMGIKVSPKARIEYNGKLISGEKKVYLILNKPKDFITTLKDTHQRKIITDLVKGQIEERVYPVGRLDRMTTGLILLTNDGEFADNLSHPSSKVSKIYGIKLDKALTRNHEISIQGETELEDGKFKPDKFSNISESRLEWGIEIHSGKNRLIRRLFEHYGYKIIKLDRVSYAGLTKKNLPRSKWRHLTEKEIIKLKYLKRH